MLFTVSEFYFICGVLSIAGALAAPFLLYSLIKKAVERRRTLAVFGPAFCLCLWTSQLLAFA